MIWHKRIIKAANPSGSVQRDRKLVLLSRVIKLNTAMRDLLQPRGDVMERAARAARQTVTTRGEFGGGANRSAGRRNRLARAYCAKFNCRSAQYAETIAPYVPDVEVKLRSPRRFGHALLRPNVPAPMRADGLGTAMREAHEATDSPQRLAIGRAEHHQGILNRR
jgi:hypothetical protein